MSSIKSLQRYLHKFDVKFRDDKCFWFNPLNDKRAGRWIWWGLDSPEDGFRYVKQSPLPFERFSFDRVDFRDRKWKWLWKCESKSGIPNNRGIIITCPTETIVVKTIYLTNQSICDRHSICSETWIWQTFNVAHIVEKITKARPINISRVSIVAGYFFYALSCAVKGFHGCRRSENHQCQCWWSGSGCVRRGWSETITATVSVASPNPILGKLSWWEKVYIRRSKTMWTILSHHIIHASMVISSMLFVGEEMTVSIR
jgi:hypothetical protein